MNAAGGRHRCDDRGLGFDGVQLRIAYVRSGSEAINNPAWDYVGFIEHGLDARVDVFTELTVERLLDGQRLYDCVVFGHNSIARHRERIGHTKCQPDRRQPPPVP